MKKLIYTVICSAAALSLAYTSAFALPVFGEEQTTDITETEEKKPDEIYYFFELSLSEIETQLAQLGYKPDSTANMIALHISKEQIKRQLSDLEPQKEEIGNNYSMFSWAYNNLMLEKLHLKAIYDHVVDPDCYGIGTPSGWIKSPDFFTIVEQEGDDTSYCTVLMGFWSNDIIMQYNDEIITMTPYEATLRTFYFINEYGDKDYFTDSCIPGNVGGVEAIMFGDATCDFTVDVCDAVLIARYLAEDSEANMTSQGKANADFNKDGDITQDDVVLILQKIARLI